MKMAHLISALLSLFLVTACGTTGGAGTPSCEVSVNVTGLDHPGIVSQISATVARAGLNVEEFSSEVISAPMSGEPLFTAVMRLAGPSPANLGALTADLEKLSAALMVEISLTQK